MEPGRRLHRRRRDKQKNTEKLAVGEEDGRQFGLKKRTRKRGCWEEGTIREEKDGTGIRRGLT